MNRLKILPKCKHANHSCDWYYHDPICDKTGKICYRRVTPCSMFEEGEYVDPLDKIVDTLDCIPEEK